MTLDGAPVLVLGTGETASELATRLREAGARVQGAATLEPALLDAVGAEHRAVRAVVCAGSFEDDAGALALVHAVRAVHQRLGAWPRSGVAVFDAPSADPAARARRAVARTLTAYAAAHLAFEDVRLNAVVAEAPGSLVRRRVSGAVMALLSGWLDAVRGQTLEIGDR